MFHGTPTLPLSGTGASPGAMQVQVTPGCEPGVWPKKIKKHVRKRSNGETRASPAVEAMPARPEQNEASFDPSKIDQSSSMSVKRVPQNHPAATS